MVKVVLLISDVLTSGRVWPALKKIDKFCGPRGRSAESRKDGCMVLAGVSPPGTLTKIELRLWKAAYCPRTLRTDIPRRQHHKRKLALIPNNLCAALYPNFLCKEAQKSRIGGLELRAGDFTDASAEVRTAHKPLISHTAPPGRRKTDQF
jgi:hypothetical protein